MTVLLSICIPTYNRIEKLKRLINSLLSVDDGRFDIVVSNNSSTDGTTEFLSSLHEDKLLIVEQNAVPSSRNIANALISARGKFALLLLDKDRIDTEYLPGLLDELEHNDSSFGYCSLYEGNSAKISEHMPCSLSSFIKLSYSCNHPSGFFFESERLRMEINKTEKLIDEQFPFVYDIIFAHFASSYSGLIVNIPVIRTETEEEASERASLTYREDNLWFSPQQTIKRYQIFIDDLESLGINESWLLLMRKTLVKRCFIDSMSGYARIMANENICKHYGISPKRLTMRELLNNGKQVFSQLKIGRSLSPVLMIRFFLSSIVVSLRTHTIKWS